MLEFLDLSLKLNANVSESELLEVGLQSYDLAKNAQEKFLNFPESNIHVWVEQGSINYKYKICVGFTALYYFVSGIDGFIGGIEKIVDYSNKAMTYITHKSIDSLDKKNTKVILHKRSTGFSGKVKFIMNEVRKGNITPDEATQNVLKLLEQEDENYNLKVKFIDEFYYTSNQVYKQPIKQLELYQFEDLEEPYENKNKPKSNKQQFSPPLKPLLQGVEIWQDPESGERQIKTYTK